MNNVSAVNPEQPKKSTLKQRKIYLPDTIWEALRAQTNWQYGGEGYSISALVFDVLDYYVSSLPAEQQRMMREVRARQLQRAMEQLNTPNPAFRTVAPSGRIEGAYVAIRADATSGSVAAVEENAGEKRPYVEPLEEFDLEH